MCCDPTIVLALIYGKIFIGILTIFLSQKRGASDSRTYYAAAFLPFISVIYDSLKSKKPESYVSAWAISLYVVILLLEIVFAQYLIMLRSFP